MKGLKKIALASAIAAVSAGAQAELKALDDSTMGEMTGQAGLTIDIETKWSIAEFMYKDAGSVLITGIEMGGNTNGTQLNEDASGNKVANSSYLDNIRMTIDVAGAGAVDGGGTLGTVPFTTNDNVLNYGFSEIGQLSGYHAFAQGNTDGRFAIAGASNYDSVDGEFADTKKTYGDGDLVIHLGFNDAWGAGGGLTAYKNGSGWDGTGMNGSLSTTDYGTLRDVATRAVDFNFQIDAIGIASSGYVQGTNVAYDANGDLVEWESTAFSTGVDANASDTILISQLDIRGYEGPIDLHIENNGNGFELTDASGNGYGDANSKIHWDAYFRITDLDVYIDIAGLYLGDVQIHNDRGDLTGLNTMVSDQNTTGRGQEILDASGNGTGLYTHQTGSFGFAHSKRTIYAVKDNVVQVNSAAGVNGSGNRADYVDGLALNTEFKGDIDIGELSFGDTRESIGEIYLTDIQSDTRWTISAH